MSTRQGLERQVPDFDKFQTGRSPTPLESDACKELTRLMVG